MNHALATREIDQIGRGSWRDLMLWTSAFVVVIGTQAGAAYWFASRAPAPMIDGGMPEAVMLELAPMATSSDNAVADMPPDQQTMVEQAEVAPTDLPEEEAVEPPPEPEVKPAEVPPEPEDVPEEAEPLPEPVPEPVQPPPEELPPPEEPIVEPPEEVIPDLVEAPEPAVVAPMPVQASASLQERRKRPKPVASPPAQKAASRTTAPPPSEAPRAEKAASTQPAAQQAAPSVSPARWQSQLMSHLNRRKQYPRASQNRREEGVVQLQFSLDGSGNVLSSSIARSSGYPELDQAVLAMISRASPVPAPPAEIAGRPITIPIEFVLGR